MLVFTFAVGWYTAVCNGVGGVIKLWWRRGQLVLDYRKCQSYTVLMRCSLGVDALRRCEQLLSSFWAAFEQLLSSSWASLEHLLSRSWAVPEQLLRNSWADPKLLPSGSRVAPELEQLLGLSSSWAWAAPELEQLLNISWVAPKQLSRSSWTTHRKPPSSSWAALEQVQCHIVLKWKR